MEIGNLIKQRELLDAQIVDVKTKDVRESIAELEANYRELIKKLSETKEAKKASDLEIGNQIKELKSEIERLTNLSLTEIYKVSQAEKELVENGRKLGEKRKELADLLAEN